MIDARIHVCQLNSRLPHEFTQYCLQHVLFFAPPAVLGTLSEWNHSQNSVVTDDPLHDVRMSCWQQFFPQIIPPFSFSTPRSQPSCLQQHRNYCILRFISQSLSHLPTPSHLIDDSITIRVHAPIIFFAAWLLLHNSSPLPTTQQLHRSASSQRFRFQLSARQHYCQRSSSGELLTCPYRTTRPICLHAAQSTIFFIDKKSIFDAL